MFNFHFQQNYSYFEYRIIFEYKIVKDVDKIVSIDTVNFVFSFDTTKKQFKAWFENS